ncbi:myotubularin-related protein 3 isoform X1 [Ischnura elegans]|uniref:myotubularin-related protein 3 isoform X1 n=1 Tax=Ischnura elegans TaxID=197161 RepID=UPI001ED86684|nr:myotubularin-related protein 3 isoform X1 [Ischnura elegans]
MDFAPIHMQQRPLTKMETTSSEIVESVAIDEMQTPIIPAQHSPAYNRFDSMQSICHVRAAEAFPKRTLEREDSALAIPFTPLCGEAVEYLGRTVDDGGGGEGSGGGILALSNYRLHLSLRDGHFSVPLGLVDQVEVRDIFYLHISCKDARSLRCTFSTNEHCLEWHRRLLRALSPPKAIEDIFAFAFYAWSAEEGGEEVSHRLGREPELIDSGENFQKSFKNEVERLGLDVHGVWRISQANMDYRLCPSYPRLLLVPACITDDTLESVARFRSARRIPAVVWRHVGNGAVIARCSQPEVGWLGWRSSEDEDLLKAISDACAFDQGQQQQLNQKNCSFLAQSPPAPTKSATSLANTVSIPTNNFCTSDESSATSSSSSAFASSATNPPLSLVIGGSRDLNGGTTSEPPSPKDLADEPEASPMPKKVLIMDARSYTTAVANRARGGGCECPEYYPSCDIQFMNLANIHSIRKSFHGLRQLCSTSAEQPNWYTLLEGTRWLQHMSGLLRAAIVAASAVDREARPVLVHCSDGWDRTPQIVALAQLLLDPYYRTMQGFQVLCEREWLDFGHKFADRCGHAVGSDDPNERCPVFLQWLDCVHQLHYQFPCSFEFSQSYLVKLAQHTYSCLFGTFLCNSAQERSNDRVWERTFSVWQFLKTGGGRQQHFRNYLYVPREQVLWPSCNVRDLVLWSEVYLGGGIGSSSSLMGRDGVRGPSAEINRSNHTGPPAPGNSAPILMGVRGALEEADVDPGVAESSSNLPKTRSYDDLIAGVEMQSQPPQQQRRCSDPSILDGGKYNSLKNGEDVGSEPVDCDAEGREDTSKAICTNDTSPLLCKLSDEKVNTIGDAKELEVKVVENGETSMGPGCTDPHPVPPEPPPSLSVEGSTDTLVAAEGAIAETSVEAAPPLPPPPPAEDHRVMWSTESAMPCRACASRRRQPATAETRLGNCERTSPLPHTTPTLVASGSTSRYSTPPFYSRTPSSGYPATPDEDGGTVEAVVPPEGEFYESPELDLDGLAPVRSDLQGRLRQIFMEFTNKVESLQRELQTTRRALIQQVCHHCNHGPAEKHDDTGSLPESVCSGGIGDRVASSSEVSWEAVEEREVGPTLWVPDHAVQRCTGCDNQFWLGRRKHHCRSCGNIFCADCSDNAIPLPGENFYDPVRVCSLCYARAMHHRSSPPGNHAGSSRSQQSNGLAGLGASGTNGMHHRSFSRSSSSASSDDGVEPTTQLHCTPTPNANSLGSGGRFSSSHCCKMADGEFRRDSSSKTATATAST